MREILFKGKHADSGRWVYGNFLADALEGTNELVSWGFIKYYDKNSMKSVIVEIDRNTLGQYTGLKDKNGNKIFEGDIIEVDSEKYDVLFADGTFYLHFLGGEENECVYIYESCRGEVIGNIHAKDAV